MSPVVFVLGPAIVVGALCSAADGALLARPDPTGADEGPQARAERERSHRALSVARLLVLLVAGAASAVEMQRLGIRGGRALAVVAAIAIGVTLITDVIARTIGDALGATAYHALRSVVHVARIVLAPVTALSERVDARIHSAFPAATTDVAERAAVEQFREVVAAEAEVAPEEATLMRGVFSLGETPVRDIMIPRVEITAIERSIPWSEVVDRVRSAGNARLPVYDDTIDNMVGILYAKDLLPAVIDGEPPAAGWQALIRPAMIIPATKMLDRQLHDFRAGRSHMAFVVDEYGGTAGIVTIEDVLEEIVGEIRDEHDIEEPPIEQRDGHRYWVSGRVPVHELEELLGRRFDHEDSATVGGLIYERLGHVPNAGEEFELDDYRVVVERVARRAVQRVYFELRSSGTDAESPE
jgi:CBS domain containing-hemolysin-like protein